MAGLFSKPTSYTPPVEDPAAIKAKQAKDKAATDQSLKDVAYWRKQRVGRSQLVNTGIYIPD